MKRLEEPLLEHEVTVYCQQCRQDLRCVTVDSDQQLVPKQLAELPAELATMYLAYCYRCLREVQGAIDREMLHTLEEQCQLCRICDKK